MSNQLCNTVQQTSTSNEQQKHLPTEIHTSEQAVQDFTEEQLDDVNGCFFAIGCGKV